MRDRPEDDLEDRELLLRRDGELRRDEELLLEVLRGEPPNNPRPEPRLELDRRRFEARRRKEDEDPPQLVGTPDDMPRTRIETRSRPPRPKSNA